MDVHRPRLYELVVLPDIVEEFLPGDYPAPVQGQVFKELEFRGREGERFLMQVNLVFIQVYLQAACLYDRRRMTVCREPSQHRLHPCHKLPGRKGFSYIIVRAEFQPKHTIELSALGREQDYGNVLALRLLLKLPEDFQALHTRKHYVEDNEGRGFFSGDFKGVKAVTSRGYLVALLCEVVFDQFKQVFLVVHHKNVL